MSCTCRGPVTSPPSTTRTVLLGLSRGLAGLGYRARREHHVFVATLALWRRNVRPYTRPELERTA